MKKLKEVMFVFTWVTTCVVFVTAVYITLFWPHESLSVKILWQILIVSFACSAGICIYPKSQEVSKKTAMLLYFLQYIEVNVIVLGCGVWFRWFYIYDMPMVLGMIIAIAFVFLLVSVLVWRRDKRMAKLMNERLQEYKPKAGGEEDGRKILI
ncbi:MAG: DUF3021 domain-containing protein [Firmicutes bacterium]|nr:DUF3021 domain-containing protein [Bacillota bacterium]